MKFAERHLAQASDFIVMNGDSFLDVDFGELIGFHREHGGMASMAVRKVPDAARDGTVQMDAHNRVVGFHEKMGMPVPGIINGGVYVFKQSMPQHIQDGPASLEVTFSAIARSWYLCNRTAGNVHKTLGCRRLRPGPKALSHSLSGGSAAIIIRIVVSPKRCRSLTRAVFLDRDGVINRKAPEGDYITRWEDFHVLPGVAAGIRLLNEAGFAVVVITNQRCIAKGLYYRSRIGEDASAHVLLSCARRSCD